MAKLSDEALAYEPKQMKNIADLETVRTDLNIQEETFGEGEGSFTAKFVEVDGLRYRVPISVLKSLKAILQTKPDCKSIKVVKTGSGMDTNYTVVPL